MNVVVAFNIIEDGEQLPDGCNKSSGHLTFVVKMDFTGKARCTKYGHHTADPESSKYAGMLSRESICILLTHAVLYGTDVMAADIRNAYLQSLTSEKHYVICDPEFGLKSLGKRALITRALYRDKAAGMDFWYHLRSRMKHLGFHSSKADPDVCMRKSIRKDSRTLYYEYVLIYTDECLVISDQPESILRKEIGEYFKLKE